MVEALSAPLNKVKIALVGKYAALLDAYLSIVEALKHGGISSRSEIEIKWVDADEVTDSTVDELLGDVDGVLVPGGFGTRGIEGKIVAAGYARRQGLPYFVFVLECRSAIIEYARNV